MKDGMNGMERKTNKRKQEDPHKTLRYCKKNIETTNADRNIHSQRKQVGKGDRKRKKESGLKEAHKHMQVLSSKWFFACTVS